MIFNQSLPNLERAILPGSSVAAERSEQTVSPRTGRTPESETVTESPGLTLRPYQVTPREKFREGLRRQMLIWHRRAGKDIDSLDFAADQAATERGTYWHLYPSHVQAKRAIWNGIDARTGERFLDRAFPQDKRVSTRSQDMQIETEFGSMWQLCGSDRYDSLVGSDVRGVTFSEWALCDPRAWDYIRPIIRANGGWVRFITTYRGRNHAYRMAQKLKNNPEWFVDIRTVEDTFDNDGKRILTDEDIQAERDEGMSEALIRQEYYCDPVAALPGAIYGRSVEQLTDSGRSGSFTYDSSLPVLAAWSTEYADQYTVAFFQVRGNEARVIGSRSFPFESLSNAIEIVGHAFPWRYISRHIVPPKTPGEVIEAFENHSGVVEVAPDLANRYTVTRDQLSTTFIDTAPRAWENEDDNNERLLDALNGYRFTEARGGGSFTNTPVNSWEKHYARTLEVFAAYRHMEPAHDGGWHPPPSTAQQDRAAI